MYIIVTVKHASTVATKLYDFFFPGVVLPLQATAFSFPRVRFPRAFLPVSDVPSVFESARPRLRLEPVPIVRATVDTPSTNFVRKITLALLNIPSCNVIGQV